MTEEEKRLRDDPGIDASFRRDLEAASNAGFDDEARRRIAARLAPLLTPGGGSGGDGGGDVTGGPSRATSAPTTGLGTGGRLVVGAVTGAVIATAITLFVTRDRRDAADPIDAAAPSASPAAVSGPPRPTAAGSTFVEHLENEAPSAEARSAAGSGVHAAAREHVAPEAVSPSRRDSEGEPEAPPTEMALLDAAHGTVNTAPARALDYLARHVELYPHGVFAEEREALAVEALVRAGRAPEAAARAERFFRTHPSSAHRARLEQLLAPHRDSP